MPVHSARHRPIVRSARGAVVVVTSLTLTAGLFGPAAQAAPVTAKDPDQPRQKVESVPVRRVPIKPAPVDPGARLDVRTSPTVTWPAAATAEVPPVAAAENSWFGGPAGATAPLSPQKVAQGKAGDLPVWIAAPSGASRSAVALPAKVKVQSLGRQSDRLVLRLSRTDGVRSRGQVQLRVGYEQFRHAFGGDYATRLKVYQVPDCAPAKAASSAACAPVPLRTRNNGSGVLSADVSVAGAGEPAATFAIGPSVQSGAGDFKATSLKPQATWTVGGSSGDFNWNYPLKAPPSTGGPSPQLSISYSSGGVDGRTTATNNQPSWVGEGFEFAPGGSIERRYASCGSKTEQTGNNGKSPTGDLCWATDNATFALNGAGGELVRDDATGRWRPRNDDGSTIERKTGANNGARDGEYWVLTSKDGTKHYFGLNRLPGWEKPLPEDKPTTSSVFTVPVFGNHANEPCHQSAFADSHCTQAYKWNLDYVVDRNGNTMSLFYDVETNNYGRNSTATRVSNYVRAGHVKRIEYGQVDGSVYQTKPVAQVLFGTEARCVPTTTCAPADYVDTPLDQECTSTTNCNNKFNPSFWTKKRLTRVTTQIWRTAENRFTDVHSWSLRQSFRDPGDNTRAGLWLEAITEVGLVGDADEAMPEVNFDSIQLANRVDPVGDGQPAMNWLRVSAIKYGSGGQVSVKYLPADCKPGDVPSAPDANKRRCHPMKWTPTGETERTDWFHKYVVEQVTETDLLESTRPSVTKVEYLSAPAWRHDDEDGLVEIGMKTWSQWRGYNHVRVTKGDGTDGPPLVTESRYFQGMDGDKNTTGPPKRVDLTDSNGVKVPDLAPLSGRPREQTTFDGGQVVDRSITDQWVSAPTATRVKSWATVSAYQIEEAGNTQVQATAGGTRVLAAKNTFDADGVLTQKHDANDAGNPSDDTCTTYEYASNAGAGIAELVKRERTVTVPCGQPATKEQVIADNRTYYDGATEVDATPTKGNPTKTERLAGFDAAGQPQYQTMSTMSYDALGRPKASTDALGAMSTTEYTPAAGGPVTQRIDTKPNGHQTVTELEPAWGEELAVTDQAGRRSEVEYDALGRVVKVWHPGRTGSARRGTVAGRAYTADNAAIPDSEHEYRIGAGGNSVVTRTLQTDGSVEESYDISDGMFRPVQSQEPAPGGGRTLTETWYDSRGLAVKQHGPYWNAAPPVEEPYFDTQSKIPTQKLISYDGAGRVTEEKFRSGTTDRWSTKRKTTADTETVEPPKGESATVQVTNPDGKLVELRQYQGQTATGDFDKTSYSYNGRGLPTKVTDPAGNQWTWEYDLRGRKVKEVDPDKGTTTYTYNDLDQIETSVDQRGVKLAYGYDLVGRKTTLHEVAPNGTTKLISEWTYDATPVEGLSGVKAKGNPSSATHWVDGQPYTTRVTAYNQAGKPLAQEVSIPASEGALAGTYRLETEYNADGEIAAQTLPGVGGLPEETLRYGYNDKDLPTTLSSEVSTYVTATAYTPYGEVSTIRQQATGGKWVSQDYEYELGTRRMTKVTTKKEVAPERVSQVAYGYDQAGNITKITDAPASASGEPTDTQCFSYDHLRRMTGAWTPASGACDTAPTASSLGGPAPYWHSWTFDQTGNRKTETRTGPAGSTTATSTYPGTGKARPHAVQSVTTTDGATVKTDTYGYDETGNLTNRTRGGVTENFSWDAQGELVKVTAGGKTTMQVVNNADGERLLRKDATGTTLYLPGDTEVLLTPDGSVTGTRHYKHGEQTVAVRIGADKLFWMGADHHGTSTTVIENNAQQTVQRRRLDPYGNTRGAAPVAWPSPRGFVGGTQDSGTGTVHLGAREYDPTLGRFISVDPEANFEDPQTINGYSYANNNPVSFTDPDGNSWFSNVVSSVTSTVKSVVKKVVKRTVETVKTAIKVDIPVIRMMLDSASNTWNRAVTWVNKTIAQTKKLVKTTIEHVKTQVKTFVKIAKVVSKKFASAAKSFGKKAMALTKKVVKAAGDLGNKVAGAVNRFVKSELGSKILHFAAEAVTGIAATMVAGAVCGPAILVCGVLVGAAAGAVINTALQTGVAVATGEQITPGKVGGWALTGLASGPLSGVRGATNTGWLPVLKATVRGKSGLKEVGNNLLKIGDPKNWKLTNEKLPEQFLPGR